MKTVVSSEENSRSTGAVAVPGHSANGELYIEQILQAIVAFRDGDFSQRLPTEWIGVHGKISDAFNAILVTSERRSNEVARGPLRSGALRYGRRGATRGR